MDSVGTPGLWAGFIAFVLVAIALDLGVFHRKARAISFRESMTWSLVWLTLALAFGGGMFALIGPEPGMEFLTGYLIEKSLSIDNIFVFVVIFSTLGIPAVHQQRILFLGILGALLMRAAMIFGGVALLARFHGLIYVFGAFLVFTGVKLFVQRNASKDTGEGRLLRALRRLIPSTQRFEGGRFFVREGARRVATPLFLALIMVELTDVVFAIDSIPAIFAVTTDPFIVFTSNIFAVLGLRALFFAVAGLVTQFRYLEVGLAGVLVFVGAKMTLVDVFPIPPAASLLVVMVILGGAIVASIAASRRAPAVPGAEDALRP